MSRQLLCMLPLGVLVVGCGSVPLASAHPVLSQTQRRPVPARFLRVDVGDRAVELTLIAADGGSNNGFNFDGYGRGELLVRVPLGWRVTVHCRNAGALFNSCAVVSGPGATRLAFPGASTRSPVRGLASGQMATFSFTAGRSGSYRLASLVPGHEQARMWDVLEVTRGGRPSIEARAGP